MSGFAKPILSFLLSWIRALVNGIWNVLNTEDGGSVYGFLSRHWLSILLILLIAGFVIDRVVYFFRWRPDLVWRSRLMRPRRQPDKMDEEPYVMEPVNQPEPVWFDEPQQEWQEPPRNTRQESLNYYHDMQAGFAPPIPPEELYAPRVRQRAPQSTDKV